MSASFSVKQVEAWLDHTTQIAKSFSPEVQANLNNLNENLQAPSFRLAIVGEFSRGKSYFINRLLGANILPVDVIPTTGVLTTVAFGETNQLHVHYSDGKVEARSLCEASWADLLALDQTGEEQETKVEASVSLVHPWLETIDAVLVDTPGAGDLSSYRASLIFQEMERCDATVLVVSATTQFSLTEKIFLEQEIIGRSIPRILVAVSKLDEIDRKDRPRVFETIRRKVFKISPNILVVPLHSIKDGIADDDAFEEARDQIEKLIAKEEQQKLRNRRIAGQIINHLDWMAQMTNNAIQSLEMTKAERDTALEQLRQEKSEMHLAWDEIRLDLQERLFQHQGSLRNKILETKDELIKKYSKRINRSKDLETDWEDMPDVLRNDLICLGKNIKGQIQGILADDFEWLQATVKEKEEKLKFNVKSGEKTFEISSIKQESPKLKSFELTSRDRQKLISRLGDGAALGSLVLVTSVSQPIGGIAVGLVAVAVRVGVNLFSDKYLQNKLSKEKEKLIEYLQNKIEIACEELMRNTSNYMSASHQQVLSVLEEYKKVWKIGIDSSLKIGNDITGKEIILQDVLKELHSLKCNISEKIKKFE